METFSRWLNTRLDSDPPFTFTYGGAGFKDIIKTWAISRATTQIDTHRKKHIITYTDPKTGLEVLFEGTEYTDFSALEWIMYFTNKGTVNTPIIENILALDTLLGSETGKFVVHHAKGSDSKIYDFQPLTDTISAGKQLKICTNTRSSSAQSFPFFTVDTNEAGIIAGIGWSGFWEAEFIRDNAKSMQVTAKMNSTHLFLYPGEIIRTPSIVLMFWEGNRMHAQNRWRKLLRDYYSPRPNGKTLEVPLCGTNWGAATEEAQIKLINWYADNNMEIECFWIDAGWSGKTGDSWPVTAASRIPNPEYYPNGLKPVSDAAHKRGNKFLLWAWPNRVLPGVEVAAEHPEWTITEETIDHGNPEANAWMIETISKLIKDHGVDLFRQDGIPYYPKDDNPDRVGINQIRHFEGFYAFWDELLRRYPGLIIDNCAGGGRKVDLETIKRSVVFWRSDFQCYQQFDPIGVQGQAYGLSFWVPISAGCTTRALTKYGCRSAYSPGLVLGWTGPDVWKGFENDDYWKNFDYELARKLLAEYREVRKYFYGDYYPLTPYSINRDVWLAWQFDRPDLDGGVVQIFRRDESPYRTAQLKLFGLDPEAEYEVKDFDTAIVKRIAGKDLMATGLDITLTEMPDSKVIVYKKI
ncbi:MAG: alpha-galactosidase [Elusimicrobiota bacterium]